jgi:hypothetical protein
MKLTRKSRTLTATYVLFYAGCHNHAIAEIGGTAFASDNDQSITLWIQISGIQEHDAHDEVLYVIRKSEDRFARVARVPLGVSPFPLRTPYR